MKQCPKCGQIYTDDFNFCLNDGETLSAQTTTNQPDEPQTVIAEPLKVEPIKVNLENNAQNDDPNSYLPVQPQLKSNSLFYFAGALVLLFGLLVGAAIVFLMNRNNSNVANNNDSTIASSNSSNRNSNQPSLLTDKINANSKKSNSNNVNVNANVKPSPSPTPKPSPGVKPSATPPIESKPICYLDDAGAGGGEVNVRQNCDVADCENDSSTVAGTYPNKTEIKLLDAGTQTANYKWLKVRLVKQNRVVWVATTKYICDGE
ncbi:MAG: hypothetical protein H7Z37_07555 [Pyrinomonadaceae bacterium]|nr:hypothetical protein [Pyrinomonadaceae bacterium]